PDQPRPAPRPGPAARNPGPGPAGVTHSDGAPRLHLGSRPGTAGVGEREAGQTRLDDGRRPGASAPTSLAMAAPPALGRGRGCRMRVRLGFGDGSGAAAARPPAWRPQLRRCTGDSRTPRTTPAHERGAVRQPEGPQPGAPGAGALRRTGPVLPRPGAP